MGNIIVSNSFVDVSSGNITVRGTTAGYPASNVMDRDNALRPYRCDDAATDDYLMKFYFGAAQTITGILLNDVNFDRVLIQGHATDVWTSPSFVSSTYTVYLNNITGRYNIYIPVTSFSYDYSRIYIPSTATAVGDYTTNWQVGTVCFLSSVTEFTRNMAHGYRRTGRKFKNTIELRSGRRSVIKTGDNIRYEGTIVFGSRLENNYVTIGGQVVTINGVKASMGSDETELWAFNRLAVGTPIVFYENRGNTQDAWLCDVDNDYEGTAIYDNFIQGNMVRLIERI